MPDKVVVVSDIHAGCRMGLGYRTQLKGGNWHEPGELQQQLTSNWEYFWFDFVASHVGRNEKFAIVVNGDVIDGVHHGSNTQISHNYHDQLTIAEGILMPVISHYSKAKYYQMSGTEAHDGQAGQMAEMLAKRLKAVPAGNEFLRNALLLKIGDGLIHFKHSIGVTASMSYEATALCKTYVEYTSNAARWGQPIPNALIRSHRHRSCKVEVETQYGPGLCYVTPGWQLKTPWGFQKGDLFPQIGGAVCIWNGEKYEIESYCKSFDQTPIEVVD